MGDTDARRAAVLAVAEIDGAVAMQVLSFALADEEREVRFAAARALGRRCVALASPSPSEILDSRRAHRRLRPSPPLSAPWARG